MIQLTVRHAKSLREKTLGLIGKKPITPLYFETRWGIHTFGVKAPIDVAILDKDERIVCLKENLKPNRVFLWKPTYKRVIELPYGTIKKKKLKLNELVSIKKVA